MDYVIASVHGKYRDAGRLQLHEFLVMSNHYHLLVTDLDGCLPDFIQELNSILSRQLNAMRSLKGTNIEKEYNLVEIHGEGRLAEHAVYTLLNPVRANLVSKAKKWKGSSSVDMQYGVPVSIKRPKLGIWKGKSASENKEASKRSGRAAYAGRWTTPDVATLVIDRPPILPHFTDEELRAHIRGRVEKQEELYAKVRHAKGRRVFGWRNCYKQHYLTIPGEREELFKTVPSFSCSFGWERVALAALRRRFIDAYNAARSLFKRKRNAVFPYGTWLMPKLFDVQCEPAPA